VAGLGVRALTLLYFADPLRGFEGFCGKNRLAEPAPALGLQVDAAVLHLARVNGLKRPKLVINTMLLSCVARKQFKSVVIMNAFNVGGRQ